jgi:hypothetical protein
MPVSLHLIRVPWGYPLSQVRRVAGAAALVLVDGVAPLRPEPALSESMLEGWGRQQRSRRLSVPLIQGRERLVRRFREFTGAWPWCWTPEQVEGVERLGRLGAFDDPDVPGGAGGVPGLSVRCPLWLGR